MTTPSDDDRTTELPAQPGEEAVPFDDLIDATAENPAPRAAQDSGYEVWEEPVPRPRARRGRWVLPTATGALVALGLTILGAGLGASQLGAEESQPEDPAANVVRPTMPEDAGGNDPERAEDPNQEAGISALVDPDWVEDVSTGSHIPEPVLAAYAGATLSVNDSFEECNLGWNTLAAIGYVETQHGSYGGARLHEDGVVHPTILGPQLDGSEDLAEIPDTDGGVLDGDDVWDRAVGPMQFLPATWEEFGQDGSGDGSADINNIEDAALSAAVYLCSWGDMTDQENWIAAILAYNPSREYNHEVAERANHYANFG
ncbi:lytic transglycosylase domain-containing protein [Nesterenkonia alba]|uniref:lytic transglycosylase domain-containing protein n=1 Tax=Nesterenkonia alba TaxID=515814 RepID=UPI0003B67D70|nr:lytic transglycosylase domain-containing protein [Nesterenkonia alba]